jgi:D-serine deaminase-like pyridoxal phosphate-dependent protein
VDNVNVETPCILIDVDVMGKNIIQMANISKANGVKLRPHIKTHKIPEIARMQIDAGAAGVTSAKVSEAEVMANNGVDDIFIAFPIIGEDKVKRVLDLNKKIRLIVGIDSIIGAKALSDAAISKGQIVEVRLEIDTGMRRTGVAYNQAVETAKKITEMKGLRLTGIYTFRGSIYQGKATSDRKKAGLEEGELMSKLADMLREEGINIIDVSVGSSPTGEFAAQVEGVTEIRPGTYVFNDAMQVNIGSCSLNDCAAKVMTTVVSRPAPDLAIIDGGSKTFATDMIPGVPPYFLKGYGIIINHDGLILERLSEEHGIIRVENQQEELNIGDKIMVVSNHICPTINLHDKVYFVKGGKVLREVPVAARGKLY